MALDGRRDYLALKWAVLQSATGALGSMSLAGYLPKGLLPKDAS